MLLPPYIGITGFTSKVQVLEVLGEFPALPDDYEGTIGEYHRYVRTRLMVGILASAKTLAGQKNRWPVRYPPINTIKEILVEDDRVLNLVHYNTSTPRELPAELVAIHQKNDWPSALHGFQLNLVWPEPALLSEFHDRFNAECPDFHEQYIVLQIGAKALEYVDHDPKKLVRMLQAYAGDRLLVDRILLDPSGGLGKPFDPFELAAYIRAIVGSDLPEYFRNIGVAGGLSDVSLLSAESVHEVWPWISIDAESRLRDASDNLVMEEACTFVRRGLQFIGTPERS